VDFRLFLKVRLCPLLSLYLGSPLLSKFACVHNLDVPIHLILPYQRILLFRIPHGGVKISIYLIQANFPQEDGIVADSKLKQSAFGDVAVCVHSGGAGRAAAGGADYY